MIMALIASKKRPIVKMVMGMVKIVSIGFTMAFKKASTIATNNVVAKPSTVI
jgi:hypothetical protein